MAPNSCLETMAGAAMACPLPTSVPVHLHRAFHSRGVGRGATETVLVLLVCWYSSVQGNMNYFLYLFFLSKMESKR